MLLIQWTPTLLFFTIKIFVTTLYVCVYISLSCINLCKTKLFPAYISRTKQPSPTQNMTHGLWQKLLSSCYYCHAVISPTHPLSEMKVMLIFSMIWPKTEIWQKSGDQILYISQTEGRVKLFDWNEHSICSLLIWDQRRSPDLEF